MTVAENVSRDFGWTREAVVGLAENPVWALVIGGLIALLVWQQQTRLSFRLQRDVEKRRLYRAYLRQIEECRVLFGNPEWRSRPEIRRLWALQAEIQIVAPDEVSRLTTEATDAMNHCVYMGDAKVVSSSGEWKHTQQYLYDELTGLRAAMKRGLRK